MAAAPPAQPSLRPQWHPPLTPKEARDIYNYPAADQIAYQHYRAFVIGFSQKYHCSLHYLPTRGWEQMTAADRAQWAAHPAAQAQAAAAALGFQRVPSTVSGVAPSFQPAPPVVTAAPVQPTTGTAPPPAGPSAPNNAEEPQPEHSVPHPPDDGDGDASNVGDESEIETIDSIPSSAGSADDMGEIEKGEGQWVHTRLLFNPPASSAKVRVSLYTLLDDDGVIRERIVVKVMIMWPTDEDDVPMEHAQTLYNWEVAAMKDLERCDNVITFHQTKEPMFLPDGGVVSRIYMEYAPHGDLMTLCNPFPDEPERPHERQIPEPFIWYVFLALSEAIFAMNTGICVKELFNGREFDVDELAEYRHPSKQLPSGIIWHQDIKPENVFLAESSMPYMAYPTPKLGDFGNVRRLVDLENASDYSDWYKDYWAGTLYHQPPEIVQRNPGDPAVSHKSDIWNVGMIIWLLIHSTRGLVATDGDRICARDCFGQGPDTFDPKIVEHPDFCPNAMYSMPLYRLASKCLKMDPSERPDFVDLRIAVQQGMEHAERTFGKGIRTAGSPAHEIPEHLVLDANPDKFRKGKRVKNFRQRFRPRRGQGEPDEPHDES